MLHRESIPDDMLFSCQGSCHNCPTGAVCNGKILFGLPSDSVWINESGVLRLVECPAGYILVRDDSLPDRDECVICPAGTYSAISASTKSDILRVSTASEAVGLCLQCEKGLTCIGGSDYYAQPGYYVSPDMVDSQQRRMVKRTKRLKVFVCPAEACLGNNTCAEGRSGTLCGVCSPGFAMVGQGCSACSDSSEQSPTTFSGLAVGGFFAVLLYLRIFIQPLFQKIRRSDADKEDFDDVPPRADAQTLSGLTALEIFGKFQQQSRVVESAVGSIRQIISILIGYNVFGLIKLIISHAQVIETLFFNLITQNLNVIHFNYWQKKAYNATANPSLNSNVFLGDIKLCQFFRHILALKYFQVVKAA